MSHIYTYNTAFPHSGKERTPNVTNMLQQCSNHVTIVKNSGTKRTIGGETKRGGQAKDPKPHKGFGGDTSQATQDPQRTKPSPPATPHRPSISTHVTPLYGYPPRPSPFFLSAGRWRFWVTSREKKCWDRSRVETKK